jgi:hypothetical protein
VVEHPELTGEAAQNRHLIRREPGHDLGVFFVGRLPARLTDEVANVSVTNPSMVGVAPSGARA